MKRTIALIVAIIMLTPMSAYAHETLTFGEKGEDVELLQETLSDYGYTLPVDGVYGPKTYRAVLHWQKVNGLITDGIVGPQTWKTLDAPAQATATATRVNPPAAQPSIPQFSDLCEEMSWYRQQAGLPEAFDAIGYRESRCQNDAKPTNTVAARYRGWWSVGVMHITNRVYGPGAAACGIDDQYDYYGTSHEQKRASACFAKVLWSISGLQPWATS